MLLAAIGDSNENVKANSDSEISSDAEIEDNYQGILKIYFRPMKPIHQMIFSQD